MDGAFGISAQGARVFAMDARDQDALFALKNFCSNATTWPGVLPERRSPRKAFAQRPVHVHLSESESASGAAWNSCTTLSRLISRPKFFQQPDGFRRGPGRRVPEPGPLASQISALMRW